MKKITLLCAFLITSLGFSQTYDLLTNGDFENGTEPWVGNNLSVVAGEAFVSETNAGGASRGSADQRISVRCHHRETGTHNFDKSSLYA